MQQLAYRARDSGGCKEQFWGVNGAKTELLRRSRCNAPGFAFFCPLHVCKLDFQRNRAI